MTSRNTPTTMRQRGRVIPAKLPQWRVNVLRLAYLLMAVGLIMTKWPLLVNHVDPWPLFEGVETCMLVALSLLSLLGLRYPIGMLPILLFEVSWKLLWLATVAAPAIWTGQIDTATLNFTYAVLWVVFVIVGIPWDHVVREYVLAAGDPWRRVRPSASETFEPIAVTQAVERD